MRRRLRDRRRRVASRRGVRTDLFMYYEDTDLSYKLHEAGYSVRFVREAVVDHEHAASSDATSPMFTRVNARNRLIVAAEHAAWSVVANALARSIVRAAREGFRGPAAHGIARASPRFRPRCVGATCVDHVVVGHIYGDSLSQRKRWKVSKDTELRQGMSHSSVKSRSL